LPPDDPAHVRGAAAALARRHRHLLPAVALLAPRAAPLARKRAVHGALRTSVTHHPTSILRSSAYVPWEAFRPPAPSPPALCLPLGSAARQIPRRGFRPTYAGPVAAIPRSCREPDRGCSISE